jgi:hypothetical protein
MDPERRRELQERREELKRKLEATRRRASVAERVAPLDAAGIPYALLDDDRPLIDWVWARFPIGGGLLSPRIAWPRVSVREQGPEAHADDAEAAAWLRRAATAHALGDPEVAVFAGDGVHPPIRVAFSALVAHPEVVSCCFDAWVACEEDGWAIEFLRFEEGWWWGRAGGGGGDSASAPP